jgi:hypothetical protein
MASFSDLLNSFAAGYAASNIVDTYKQRNQRKPARQRMSREQLDASYADYLRSTGGGRFSSGSPETAMGPPEPMGPSGLMTGYRTSPMAKPDWHRSADVSVDVPSVSSEAYTTPYNDAGRMDFRAYDLPEAQPLDQVQNKVDEASSQDLMLLSDLLGPTSALAGGYGVSKLLTPSGSSPVTTPNASPRSAGGFKPGQPRYQPAAPRYQPSTGGGFQPGQYSSRQPAAATGSRLAGLFSGLGESRLGQLGTRLLSSPVGRFALNPYVGASAGTWYLMDLLDPRSEFEKQMYRDANWGPEELGP